MIVNLLDFRIYAAMSCLLTRISKPPPRECRVLYTFLFSVSFTLFSAGSIAGEIQTLKHACDHPFSSLLRSRNPFQIKRHTISTGLRSAYPLPHCYKFQTPPLQEFVSSVIPYSQGPRVQEIVRASSPSPLFFPLLPWKPFSLSQSILWLKEFPKKIHRAPFVMDEF